MSVLSDVASKLQQAQSAASNKSKTANYGEALGFIISDMLNSSASDLNPFIRKGAAAQVHFNELDAVEEERERLLGYRDQAGGIGNSGFSKSNQNDGGSGSMLGGAALLATTLAAKKLITSIGRKFASKVMPGIAKNTAKRTVASAIAGPLAPLVAIGGIMWGVGEAVAGLLDIMEEEGIDVSAIRNELMPITDQLNEAAHIVTSIGESDFVKDATSLVQKNLDNMHATGVTLGNWGYDAVQWTKGAAETTANAVAAGSSQVSETLGLSNEPAVVSTSSSSNIDSMIAAGVPGNADRARRMEAAGNQQVTRNPSDIPARSSVSSAARSMATGDFGGMDMDVTGIARKVDIDALRSLIFGAESGKAGYDAVIGGRTIVDANGKVRNPTDMTIGEIKEWQARTVKKDGNASSAVGAYQIVGSTMNDSQTTVGISDSAKFTPDVQDKMFMNLLKKRKIDQFESGAISGRQFIQNLSQEWAGLKNMSGKGHYDEQNKLTGAWINKATVSAEAIASTFVQTAIPAGGDSPAKVATPNSTTSQIKNVKPTPMMEGDKIDPSRSNPLHNAQPINLDKSAKSQPQAPAITPVASNGYKTPAPARIPSAFDMLIASDLMRTV